MNLPSARYFDRWAKTYDSDLARFDYRLPAIAAALTAPILPSGAHILDIGIGTGLIARAIKSACPGTYIAGVDISAKMLASAQMADEVHICDAGSQILPFAENTFDAAVAVGVLEFIAHPAWTLIQAARVLKPGGHLIVVYEPIDHAADYKPGILRGVIAHTPECAVVRRIHYTPLPRFYNKYLHDTGLLIQIARAAGFEIRHRNRITAYTRPRFGPVAHDILVLQKT